MRRHSLVGPLILITIGALFLVNNLRPELPMLELLSKWWPFLLIGWGALRLVEILYLAATSKPLPSCGISGGEWALVVFIFLIGSGLLVVRRYGPTWPHGNITLRGVEVFGQPFEYPLAGQKAAGKTPRIIVENLRGNVRVTGADTEEVKVTGSKTIRAYSRGDADSMDKQSPLEIVVQGEQVIVRTNQERIGGSKQVKADLEITAPRGASFEARGRYGDFDIVDLAGRVEITSDNAGVRAQNLGGNFRAELKRSDIVRVVNSKGSVGLSGRGGDVELENIEGEVTVNGSFYGELTFRNLAKPVRFDSQQSNFRMEKIAGQMRLTPGHLSGNNLTGPIIMSTRSKDLELSDFSQSLELTVDRGDITLRPGRLPLAKIDAHTKSGHIDLAVPKDAKFEIKASSNRGAVENDFGAPLKVEEQGRGAVLNGATGQGPTLTLRTENGNVTLRKATAAPEKQTSVPSAAQPLKVTSQ